MEIKVRNPRNGTFDYTIRNLSKEEITSVALHMRNSQAKWQEYGIEKRCEILLKWHDALLEAKESIIASLVKDTGRYHESVLEFNLLPTSIKRWVNWAQTYFLQNQSKASLVPHIFIQQENVPYELVSVISPWNFPLLLSTIDMIPALLAGCAIIVKPSEITPRFITPIQKTIDAIPELSQVLKYIEGDGLTGSNLIELADLTCFTGSVATGRKVYQKSAELFKPVFLELGGKDAAIILKGANLEKAAKSILWGSCVNNGHSCLSIERVYVDAEVFEAFLKNLVSEVASIRLAYDDPQQGHIGPLISERQVAIINDHLADALAKGALLVTGSTTCELVNGGYYCKPTILTNVNHSMKIMTEETFGPIIPIMGFQSHHEAIFLANDTIFGLSGAVFAETQEKALQLARKMKAGAISINECALTAIVHDGEKNSFNMSGLGGSRMGPTSLQRFMRKKAYLINQNVEDSPWWFSSVNGV